MSPLRPTRRPVFVAPLLVAAGGLALFVLGALLGAAGGSQEGVLVATSVCEAHELKARAAEDPDLEIEIPPQFNTPWPSYEACLAHERAQDPDAPGPVQPIQFSHQHHAGRYQIACEYCHSGTDRTPTSGVPPVALCMGCHVQFPPSYDELEGIRTLKGYWERGEPVEWVQVHRLPEHVQFRHNRHARVDIACQRCHGLVEEMDKLWLTADTVWWPWLLPARKLQMGWCIQCHRTENALQDCYTCHY